MDFGIWSIVPPLLAIGLALITRQVILSLFVGVLAGSLILGGWNPALAFKGLVETVVETFTDDWNARVILFTCLLGSVTGLIHRSGGFQAFGQWAGNVVRSRKGAQVATWFTGLIIFFDDYFDCLTTGSVMRPITDRYQVSREKLAYIVDSTAASICTIIPISTWVAYMISLMNAQFEASGLDLPLFGTFLQSIPFNLYAISAVLLVLYIAVSNVEFGPMFHAERRAALGGQVSGGDVTEVTGQDITSMESSPRGRLSDLALPIIVLVGMMCFGLLYTGGLFDGVPFVDAIGDADAATALIWSTLLALVVAVVWYTVRSVVSMAECMVAVLQGVKAMMPALMILVLAWSIGSVTSALGLGEFVARTVGGVLAPWAIPVILFIAAGFVAFSTGTSWGTFAIMIPVAIPLAIATGGSIPAVIGAVFGGGVMGDHCSPISDTTILSSTGASCNHIDHVRTQLPYALLTAAVASIGFIVAGLTHSAWIGLAVTLVILFGAMHVLNRVASSPTEVDAG